MLFQENQKDCLSSGKRISMIRLTVLIQRQRVQNRQTELTSISRAAFTISLLGLNAATRLRDKNGQIV